MATLARVLLAGPALVHARLWVPEICRSIVGVKAVGLFMAASRKVRAGLMIERKFCPADSLTF